METQDEDNLKPLAISEDINADVNDDSVNEEVNSILDIDNDQIVELNDTDANSTDDAAEMDLEDDTETDLDDDDIELAEYDDLDADVNENDLRALDGLDQDDK
jgi:hypothetical protein